jgi:DNA ligase-1
VPFATSTRVQTPNSSAPDASTSASTSSSPFLFFCRAAEEIRATSKRLEKAAVIAKYFQDLGDDDLVLAARFFSGFVFSPREGRTVNVGGAALLHAIVAATGVEDDTLRARIVVLGDPGDAAFEAMQASAQTPGEELESGMSLQGVAEFCALLASTSGSLTKRALVTETLRKLRPLEGKYLVKLLVGDARIGLKEGAVEDAVARASGRAVGEVQRANMLCGDIGTAALLARRSALESAGMSLFAPLKFMLASPAADSDEIARLLPQPFVVEDKYDGIRAQAHVGADRDSSTRAALFSRTLDDISRAFPDLAAPLQLLHNAAPGGLMLDGEIVPVNLETGAITLFQDLQKRLGRKTPTAQVLADIPAAFIAYDVLFFDGRALLDEPFSTRRAILEKLPFDGVRLKLAPSRLFENTDELDAEFVAARERGNEGLMAKDPRATYKPGRRGKEWLKVKKALATLDVVVTSVEVGNGRRAKFLSDYTFAVRASAEDATLLNVGKAYSGLTDVEVMELSEWFHAHTLAQYAHGKVRVVEPKVVMEITFDRVQPSPRHKSGYALRFPRILRVRTDKSVDEIDTLEAVKKLAG